MHHWRHNSRTINAPFKREKKKHIKATKAVAGQYTGLWLLSWPKVLHARSKKERSNCVCRVVRFEGKKYNASCLNCKGGWSNSAKLGELTGRWQIRLAYHQTALQACVFAYHFWLGYNASKASIISPIGNITLNVSKKGRPSFQTEACKNSIFLRLTW